MEKVVSIEEKIRRAEEIYQKRKQGETRPVAKVTVNNKRDIKLLRKMLIQILICVIIYFIIYTVQKNQYIFSEDFINKTNEMLSYDVNLIQLYETIMDKVVNNSNKETEEIKEEIVEQESVEEIVDEKAIGGAEQEIQEEEKVLTQAEMDIQNIKNTTSFIKPVEGIVSSKYGQRDTATGNVPKNHTGTDIAANLGTKIKSATDGEVVLASEEGDYGKHLKIQIGEVSIIYAHCNQLYVKQGDKVIQGQEIAEVGSTGNSTGPHLHFEIRISEKTVDPQTILEL